LISGDTHTDPDLEEHTELLPGSLNHQALVGDKFLNAVVCVDVQTPNHSLLVGDRSRMSALGVTVDQRQLATKSESACFLRFHTFDCQLLKTVVM